LKIKAINGFKDILPEEAVIWQHIETRARDIFHRFGMQEIRLPILEKTELFARSIGESTDIVEKEMYTFADKGITMRPEATASLLRAFIEHGMHVRGPVQRLFTIGPMFRHERPQKGRLRQFHQMDCEIIGAGEPEIDAELMAMAWILLDELGIRVSLEINSLGCRECRPAFRTRLVHYLRQRQEAFCTDCRRRTESNPLRVLDCKNPSCRELVQEAPSILDSLCPSCQSHFLAVQEQLQLLQTPFSLNRFMVRGLDYYSRTTFEFVTTDLGAQSAVGAGGRYDSLIGQLGGPKDLPGVGFALGMERLVLLMEQQDRTDSAPAASDLFVAALGKEAGKRAAVLVHQARLQGMAAAMDYSNRSLKAQMKQAARLGARFTLIIGENELEKQEGILRNMDNQEQVLFPLQGTPGEQAARLRTLVLT